MRFWVFNLCTICLFIVCASLGQAQEITEEGAEKLEKSLSKLWEKDLFPMTDGFQSHIKVTTEEDHYLVVLDQNVEDDKADVSVVIKGYKAKLYPTDIPSQFYVLSIVEKENAIKIVTHEDNKEPDVIEVSFLNGYQSPDRQSLFDVDMGQYIHINEVMEQMRLTLHEGGMEKVNVIVDKIGFSSKYRPSKSDPEKLDGFIKIAFHDLKGQAVNPKDDNEKFQVSIDTVLVNNAVREWDYRKEEETQMSLSKGDDFRLSDLFSLAKISASKTEISGIKAMDAAGKTVFDLDNISYKGAMSGVGSNKSHMSVSMGVNGLLKTLLLFDDPKVESVMGIIPNDVSLSLKGTDIPVLALENEFLKMSDAKENKTPLSRTDMLQNKEAFVALLADNGTSGIVELNLKGEDFLVELNSDFKADTVSPYNVSGEVILNFFNMDDYLNRIIEVGKVNPKNPILADKIPQVMAGMAMLQMMGQQKTDPEKGEYREYKLVLDQEGDLSLNGVPLSKVMGGLMSQSQGTAQ